MRGRWCTWAWRRTRSPARVKEEQIDWDKLTAGWDATIGGELAAIAGQVCDLDAQPDGPAPPREVQQRAIQAALASVQAKHSNWTRADLMKNLAWSMGQSSPTWHPRPAKSCWSR